jgi:transcriptional regulator with XRE-family HTH domain
MNEIGDWLLTQLEDRGWSQAELARRSEISQPALSRIISGTQQAGPDACVAVARAFGEPPEKVFRLAGLLPPLPPPVAEEHEALAILRNLPGQARTLVMTQLRALAGRPTYPAVAEPAPQYNTPPLGEGHDVPIAGEGESSLDRQLLREFQSLPEEWQTEALEEIKRLRRLSRRVRIIGDDEEEEEEKENL